MTWVSILFAYQNGAAYFHIIMLQHPTQSGAQLSWIKPNNNDHTSLEKNKNLLLLYYLAS